MSEQINDPRPRQTRPKPMVNRCVCHEVPFQEILAWSDQREHTTLEDIRKHFGCGGSCGMCKPYLREVLDTRETSVPLRLPADKDQAN
ncbi:MAG: (2Fe-2S)-binding protein [Phycisphaerales bacterium]|jgi:bacterioferritin-associated ferredoxin|nr:(2Fe-2S)-binding protein [Phycisphaerales bacterium]